MVSELRGRGGGARRGRRGGATACSPPPSQPAPPASSPAAGSKGRVLASVTPAPGRALLHRHGDACLLHEGARVLRGVKYVLRSDVVFRE